MQNPPEIKLLSARKYAQALRKLTIGPRQKTMSNHGGLSRQAILQSRRGQSQALGTDYMDLLQIHRFEERSVVGQWGVDFVVRIALGVITGGAWGVPLGCLFVPEGACWYPVVH